MAKEDNELFQARIKNEKQRIFIDEYITITQKRLEKELGITHCSKGLALFKLLQQNAGNNGAMKDGRLIPEYYHQEWIDERLKEFERASQGFVYQIRLMNKLFPKIMKRENDIKDLKQYKMITNRKDAMLFCHKYFTEKLIPKVDEFNEKFQDGE